MLQYFTKYYNTLLNKLNTNGNNSHYSLILSVDITGGEWSVC